MLSGFELYPCRVPLLNFFLLEEVDLWPFESILGTLLQCLVLETTLIRESSLHENGIRKTRNFGGGTS